MLNIKVGIISLALCLTLYNNEAFAERKFSRYKGRALRFGIALYQGVPPENYRYESLGYIKGEYKSRFSDSSAYTISKALENLADKAKEMGANAVIKIEPSYKKNIFSYDGEAVIFKELPER